MAMEDPHVLLPISMSFNPFRSSSHSSPPSRPAHQQGTRHHDLENDSWHTNAPTPPNDGGNHRAPPSPQKATSSSALSWFSSWTSSSTITTTSPSRTTTTTTTTATASSAVIIQDGQSSTLPQPPLSPSHPPLSSQTAPAQSMTMNRGTEHAHNVSPRESNAPIHDKLGAAARGCLPNIHQNGSVRVEQSPGTTHANDVEQFNLPPYPAMKAPETQRIQSTPRTKKELLEDFPFPETKPPLSAGIAADRRHSTATDTTLSSYKPTLQKEETTFPGFALFQTAKAQYFMGKYSEALDTTTACLASQKAAMGGHAAAGAVSGMAMHAMASSKPDSPTKSRVVGDGHDASTAMMPLDLRSTFVSGVGSSVRGVVQSLTEKDSHPMLSNSIAIMVAQYPSYPCVAQTLFLRGCLLSECGKSDGDFSLLEQAIQHVEMAVAIYRNLRISDEDLVEFLISLGNMRMQLGHFDVADMTFEEAVSILRSVRSDAKNYHIEVMQRDEVEIVEEEAADCSKFLKRVTRDFATALYLHGKSHHCQRMHGKAFACYNKALTMLRKAGASRRSLGVKRIVRQMKNRYALEKLVSSYWDDSGLI